MRYSIFIFMMMLASISFGGILSTDVVTVTNTSGFESKIKVLDPESRTECSNEIALPKNYTITITTQQLSCTGNHFRIKAYGHIEKNAKTSSVFTAPARCTVHVDKALDDRFHVDCQ